MIFPDVPLQAWLEKYPELKIVRSLCDGCGDIIRTSRPFLMRGYAGLRAEKCPCGKARHTATTMVTTSSEEFQRWTDVLNPGLAKGEIKL